MFTEPLRVSGMWHTNYRLAGHLPFQPSKAKLRWVLRVWLLCQRIWKIPSDQLNRMFLCTMWSILTTCLAGQCCGNLCLVSSKAFHLPWVFSCAQQNPNPLNILKWMAACLLCSRLFDGTSESQNQCAPKHFHRNLFCPSDWNCIAGDGQTLVEHKTQAVNCNY